MSGPIGEFFLVLGLIILVIFWGTFQAQAPSYGLCLGGLIVFGFGLFLWWRARPAPVGPEHRFGFLRKVGSRSDKKKKDKKKK